MNKLCAGLILFLVCGGLWAGTSLAYREAGKTRSSNYTVQLGEAALTINYGSQTVKAVLDRATGGVQSYSEVTADGRTTTGQRNGRTVTLDDGTGRKTFKLEGDEPWFVSYSQLVHFAKNTARESDFFFIDGDKPMKMRAIREKQEELVVMGKKTPTWRVKITLADFRGAFWSFPMWFCVSDGIMVHAEELRGAPGSPVVVADLVSESAAV